DLNEQQALHAHMNSVIMEPSYKILMGFEYPWWKKLGEKYGHSITDLPMRQCYYFGTDPENRRSLLLGSYNDMNTVTFWEGLAHNPELFQIRRVRKTKLADYHPYADVQASRVMVDEVLHQLRELHGLKRIPEPYITWFKNWTLDPYGGGYHAWKAGYDVQEVMKYMRRPMPAENVYICGEAYSALQGWVEGALCVAERMLQEHFDLDWPEWLDKDYYLGW
ncbi:MAG TPA: FAD-dependent oxidoreductase, partial [Saprospiraceae bacterium]|nr:FAD-dependent oxidoreductase [Saprospiraceae bacterium]